MANLRNARRKRRLAVRVDLYTYGKPHTHFVIGIKSGTFGGYDSSLGLFHACLHFVSFASMFVWKLTDKSSNKDIKRLGRWIGRGGLTVVLRALYGVRYDYVRRKRD